MYLCNTTLTYLTYLTYSTSQFAGWDVKTKMWSHNTVYSAFKIKNVQCQLLEKMLRSNTQIHQICLLIKSTTKSDIVITHLTRSNITLSYPSHNIQLLRPDASVTTASGDP